ncbi:MAG TPA: hypothetical protein DEA43_03745 [Candidatus Moranbacteria bacterium]|nr:hypothetical protein [Candidatus Moranbacteria bacterium]HBT45969.1 hypothetical protein [Candidatus Moranbacteria bacterium]
MQKKKLISIVLCFSVVFFSVFALNVRQAKAWPVSIAAVNALFEGAITVLDAAGFSIEQIEYILDMVGKIGTVAAKVAALMLVQKITQAIIGDDGGGGVVSDWNNYLYVSPQQRAMAQMNSFFNTVSRGRLSSLNYEGIGPNYDSYLRGQAIRAIDGQVFVTNLQDTVTDPTKMFDGGNMKGIMTYMQCANNVACYTLTSTAKYNSEFTKAQEIAKLSQDRGFLPVKDKKTGKIMQPAALAASALTQVDQLGTQLIMSTDFASQGAGAFVQIAAGTGISIASRSLNYATANEEGKAAVRNKNDQFPFSLGYSANGGIGVSAGGVTASTGAGSFSGGVQIGNICATGNFSYDSSGAAVDVRGNKINCPPNTKAKTTYTPPSVNVTNPDVTVTTPTITPTR